MSVYKNLTVETVNQQGSNFLGTYLETLSMVERLHRL